MRLLLTHQGWPDDGAGGSELHVAEVAAGLAARGHEVAVLAREQDASLPDGVLREAGTHAGARLIRLNNCGRHARDLGALDPAAEHALAGVIERLRPELVHAHHVAGFGAHTLRSVRARGTPLVLTVHDHWAACLLGQLVDRELRPCPGPAPSRCATCLAGPRTRGFVRAFAPAAMSVVPALGGRFLRRQRAMHALLAAADALIAPSHYFARRLAALGFREPQVVPLGLATREPVSRPVRPPGAPLRVGFIGSLIPSKGVHVLAEAMRGLPPEAFDLQVHGPAPDYHGESGYVDSLRARLGSRAGALRGPFAAAELPLRLAELDVLVIPSLWEENAPRVLDEAFAAGVVPVVSSHGRLAEAVRDHVDGLHFRRGDASGLARALVRLREEAGLRERLAGAAPAGPSFDAMLDGLEAAYAAARARFGARVGRVGVVVLDCGDPERTARAVASALDRSVESQVLVVHNGPGAEAALPTAARCLRLERNLGYAGGMNAGLRVLGEGGCDRALLLNNDARLEPGALRALAEAVVDGVGASAPVVWGARERRVESCGLDLGPWLLRPRLRDHGARRPAALARPPAALSGVALMVSLPALARIGPLCEDYFHGFEDVDLSVRLRAAGLGLAVVDAGCVHEGAATIGPASPLRHYYAARNHLLAAERLFPLRAPWRGLRRGVALGLAVAHAVRQREVPRAAALRAAWRGAADAWRGLTGPA